MAGQINCSDVYGILTSNAFLQGLVTLPGHPMVINVVIALNIPYAITLLLSASV